MTVREGETHVPPAEAIDDFSDLHPRPVGINRFSVLSLASDGFTAYQCDLEEMTCECRNKQFNRDEGEICKHLAAALWKAPDIRDINSDAVRSLANELEGLRLDIDEALVRSAEAKAEQTASTETTSSDTSDGSAPSQDRAGSAVEVSDVRDWLEAGFAKPGLVELREGRHNNSPGIVVEPDNRSMTDAVFESFKGLVNSLQSSETHVGFGDDPCQTCGESDGEYWYFVPETAQDEVFR